MIKAAAGISDDDPLEEAFEKLRACCAEEAVADVLGLAAGLHRGARGRAQPAGDRVGGARGHGELADVQPLVLMFEDIHWAEEPMLDLIEHLADWVRAPLLIVCLARPELLDKRPGWGGGRVRSTAIELEPLSEDESKLLVQKLLGQLAGTTGEAPPRCRARCSNALKETRSSSRRRSGCSSRAAATDIRANPGHLAGADRGAHRPPLARGEDGAPARIGHRPGLLEGRARASIARPRGLDSLIDDLLQREFLLREPRSSISGESAYRFKHFLIREVAYGGLAKLARAQHHARFAEWLAERAGDELLEIRAHHLDRAVEFMTELDGAPPEELAEQTAGALVKAAKRSIAREAYVNARRLGLRALELRPTLGARYVAARAAWRLGLGRGRGRDAEGPRPGPRARRPGAGGARADRPRRGDPRHAATSSGAELADEALAIFAEEDDPVAHFDGLTVRAIVASWQGSEDEFLRFMERAYVIALDAKRKDLQTMAAQSLAQPTSSGSSSTRQTSC